MSINQTPQQNRRGKSHPVAGTFYLILAFFGVAGAVNGHPALFVAALLCGLYSVYLYRGGRWVIFFF